MQGSELYQRNIAPIGRDDERDALMHKVWDQFPWMVDAYTGSPGNDRYREIRQWCEEQFGPEAWPIHGRHGDWHVGGATIHGWTWIGFKTKAMMEQFLAAWPAPNQAAAPDAGAGGADNQ